eukprot:3435825-Pleurochrysis_carterae.AAC.1
MFACRLDQLCACEWLYASGFVTCGEYCTAPLAQCSLARRHCTSRHRSRRPRTTPCPPAGLPILQQQAACSSSSL